MSQVVTYAHSLDTELNVITRKTEDLALAYRKSVYKSNGEIILGVAFKLQKGNRDEIQDTMNNIILKRKTSQPLEYPSAGSTFKRPQGYFAAALIDECGLKGKSVGGAMVSTKHAGFVINYDKATCNDVLGLIKEIKQIVKEQKGVDLETEVIFVGR
jgi:UDP-N-acetylmuramate dehydrogenase